MNIGDVVICKQGGDKCLVINTFGLESVVLRSLEYTSLGDFVAQISALEVVKPYKPSWDKAPKWAKFLAMDESGAWNWYENLPTKMESAFVPNGGKCLADKYSRYWENSLEGRRKAQEEKC